MRLNKPHPLTAALLKQCREKSGLEQIEFINHHNIPTSQGTFSRWELGLIAVPVCVLLDLGLLVPVGGGVNATD